MPLPAGRSVAPTSLSDAAEVKKKKGIRREESFRGFGLPDPEGTVASDAPLPAAIPEVSDGTSIPALPRKLKHSTRVSTPSPASLASEPQLRSTTAEVIPKETLPVFPSARWSEWLSSFVVSSLLISVIIQDSIC